MKLLEKSLCYSWYAKSQVPYVLFLGFSLSFSVYTHSTFMLEWICHRFPFFTLLDSEFAIDSCQKENDRERERKRYTTLFHIKPRSESREIIERVYFFVGFARLFCLICFSPSTLVSFLPAVIPFCSLYDPFSSCQSPGSCVLIIIRICFVFSLIRISKNKIVSYCVYYWIIALFLSLSLSLVIFYPSNV